ncbi:hypothetical protein CEUSTIGMA_g2262.t1 [Chlamydomonas eustigma]|uniref:START domain-containing protein n=1 Tax=Chlamydomonas eustigma TaxID=1157962 RepID=A0A250WVI6_9CHLO|nr:hypothetical protein CEUSTIGMA_g2262.t1 [Chlamydomonas eustigma]|eukprot:GAX74815.1 hypothetical protein CEUSTIGMA_g2262.t1 [Chlamydomonas eustigma]
MFSCCFVPRADSFSKGANGDLKRPASYTERFPDCFNGDTTHSPRSHPDSEVNLEHPSVASTAYFSACDEHLELDALFGSPGSHLDIHDDVGDHDSTSAAHSKQTCHKKESNDVEIHLDPASASADNESKAAKTMSRKHLVNSVVKLVKEMRACRACGVLMQYIKESGASVQDLLPDFKAFGVDALRLLETAERVNAAVESEKKDEGWNKVSDGDFRLFYRHTQGSMMHCFRARCTIEAPAEHILCIAREFDLCREWNKYCLVCNFLKEYSLTDILAFATVWMPWPLSNMDLVAEATGVDLLREHDSLMIDIGTPDEIPEGVQLPKSWGQNMKVKFERGSFICLQPLLVEQGQPPLTRVCVSFHVDSGIKNVPEFLISFVLRILAPFMYRQVIALLHHTFSNPGSKLAQRLQIRSELYSMVRNRISDFLSRKGAYDVQQYL